MNPSLQHFLVHPVHSINDTGPVGGISAGMEYPVGRLAVLTEGQSLLGKKRYGLVALLFQLKGRLG